MRIRHLRIMVGVLLILASLISACQPIGEGPAAEGQSGSAKTIESMKVAFVYVGPVGDLGWSYAHDQGRWRWKSWVLRQLTVNLWQKDRTRRGCCRATRRKVMT